jgi:hypothetical protein
MLDLDRQACHVAHNAFWAVSAMQISAVIGRLEPETVQWLSGCAEERGAKTALPNGYCAMPLQQQCEFANACLTCPVFVTTPEFLPQHHRQLEQTQALIESADRNGHQRLAEMNRTVEKNLLAHINGLTTVGSCYADGGGCSCSQTKDSDAG